MKKEVTIIDGMSEIIKRLSELYTLIIVSSTISAPIEEFLKKHDLARYFIEIMENDVHARKVEKIKMIFQKYNTDASKCIFVTDTLGDMKEAAVTSVATIGVAWGFHNKETLLGGNPFAIVEKPNELLSSISNYFSRNL